MPLRFEEYRAQDGYAWGQAIANGDVLPKELLACAVDRARAVNPGLNAITVWLEDFAEQLIEQLPPAGTNDGPGLRGVPFLLKDLYSFMAGTPQTNGSRLGVLTSAQFDSTLMARYRQAGLVVFGKTASPEMGLNVVSEPLRTGPCRNPWDHNHSPGGSSGGAAAAVASGIVPIAHASDGGGSIRIPASHCGLFGFKPSRGLVPTGPAIGEGWSGLATSNCISRSVRDTALLMDLTCAPEPGAPYASPRPASGFLAALDTPPKALRIAYMPKPIVDYPVSEPNTQAVQKTAELLTSLGHQVEPAAPNLDAARFGEAFMTIITANLANDLGAWRAAMGAGFKPELLETATRELAERGRHVKATDLLSAIQTMHRTGREIGRFFSDFDLVLSPTTAAPAPEIGYVNQDDSDVDRFLSRNLPYTAFTALFNAVGCPAASLPLHHSGNLPIGSMIAGPLGSDALILALSRQIEIASPWFDEVPN